MLFKNPIKIEIDHQKETDNIKPVKINFSQEKCLSGKPFSFKKETN